MAHALTMALLVLAVASVVVTLAAHVAVRRVLRRTQTAPAHLPPVSILKPLKGCEDGLYENLVALAQQDYPELEIICGTADPDDPALAVAERVRDEFPYVRMRVVTGAPAFGLNPKVTNLRHIARFAQYPCWLVSDSNVRPDAGYVRAMATTLAAPGVGLVHSVLGGVGEDGLGAALENLHMNGWVASAVAGADVLAGHPCVIGKSMMFRRSDLDRVGGWQSVRDLLAEDYVLGQRFAGAGLRVALCPHVLPVVSSRRTIGQFWNRHVRWGQMRRCIAPLTYLAEPLLNPVPLLCAVGALGALGWLGTGRDGLVAVVAAGLVALAIAASAASARALRGQGVPLAWLALVPIKDFLVLAMWAVGLVWREIDWRGHRMRIGRGSELTPIRAHAWTLGRALRLASLPARAPWLVAGRTLRRTWRVVRRRAIGEAA